MPSSCTFARLTLRALDCVKLPTIAYRPRSPGLSSAEGKTCTITKTTTQHEATAPDLEKTPRRFGVAPEMGPASVPSAFLSWPFGERSLGIATSPQGIAHPPHEKWRYFRLRNLTPALPLAAVNITAPMYWLFPSFPTPYQDVSTFLRGQGMRWVCGLGTYTGCTRAPRPVVLRVGTC